ncbi:MAG: hypothetical protein QOE65_623 [Solirubrobacteraceae bacterium]|jgi:hypothetical protein|nr:hypothetical protein [Solirubrobacteraceae bacterium]
MPRRKKPPHELTTDEALRKLFPKEVRAEAKKEARKSSKDEGKKNTKKDSTE